MKRLGALEDLLAFAAGAVSLPPLVIGQVTFRRKSSEAVRAFPNVCVMPCRHFVLDKGCVTTKRFVTRIAKVHDGFDGVMPFPFDVPVMMDKLC